MILKLKTAAARIIIHDAANQELEVLGGVPEIERTAMTISMLCSCLVGTNDFGIKIVVGFTPFNSVLYLTVCAVS